MKDEKRARKRKLSTDIHGKFLPMVQRNEGFLLTEPHPFRNEWRLLMKGVTTDHVTSYGMVFDANPFARYN
jgi:hypothetical protein